MLTAVCMNKLDVFNKANMRATVSDVRPGDTVRLFQRFKEGDKMRTQSFEGIVIARKHGTGLQATITVRKVSGGIGIEKIVPLHSASVEKIEVVRHARVRRAKLYYIRDKAAKEVRRKMKSMFAGKLEPVEEEKGE